MVTPERELPPAAQLGPLVSMLFPSLAEESPPPEPKGYVICGVHFVPLFGRRRLRWLLTRAPHVSNVPRPSATFTDLQAAKRLAKHPSAWKATGWLGPQLFDGRYWVRILHRLPCNVRIAPFETDHHKPFREALGDDRAKQELSAMLRRYAPGKVRYTLPAIYATCDVSGLLAGGDWWPPAQAVAATESNAEEMDEAEIVRGKRSGSLSSLLLSRLEWEKKLKSHGELQLLALPALGVALPGLDDWLRWEVRYRKVDDRLLRLSWLGGGRL